MCVDCNSFAELMWATDYNYCPMCGEKLVSPQQKIFSEKYWDYLASLDSKSEEWKIIFDLGKKWSDEGKDLDYELKKYMNS